MQSTKCVKSDPEQFPIMLFALLPSKRALFVLEAAGVAGAKGRGRSRGRGRGRSVVVDDVQQDLTESYTKCMGKWARRSVQAIADPVFWILMLVSHRLSSKLDRLLWTMQKYSSTVPVVPREDEDPFDSELSNLARLSQLQENQQHIQTRN